MYYLIAMETLISLGPVSISTFGVFTAFAFLVFSFSFWHFLREDFAEEKILSLTVLLAIFFLLGARGFYILTHFREFGFSFSWLFWRASPGFSLLGGILASLVTLFWRSKKDDWGFWQVADSAVFAFASAFLVLNLGIFFSRLDFDSFLGFIFSILFLAAAVLLTSSYRKFLWYKSGKPGFVASICLSFFSFGKIVLELFVQNRVYFFWTSLGFGLLGLVGLIACYRRSERNIKEDWGNFFKKVKPVQSK